MPSWYFAGPERRMGPGPNTIVVPAGFQGLSDTSAGAPAHFWGLRAVSAAYAASLGPLIDIYDHPNAGSLLGTINVLATGDIDRAAILALGGGTLYVGKIYDQIGTTHLQASVSIGINRPVLTTTGLTGASPTSGRSVKLDFIAADGAHLKSSTGTATSISQPFTTAFAGTKNAGGTNANYYAISTGPGVNFCSYVGGAWAGAGGAGAGSGDAGPNTAGTPYASAHLINGASSKYTINGSEFSPSTPGANAFNAADVVAMGAWIGQNLGDGSGTEVCVWASSLSTAQRAEITANQQAYWGF